jgi:hypothetical protein
MTAASLGWLVIAALAMASVSLPNHVVKSAVMDGDPNAAPLVLTRPPETVINAWRSGALIGLLAS